MQESSHSRSTKFMHTIDQFDHKIVDMHLLHLFTLFAATRGGVYFHLGITLLPTGRFLFKLGPRYSLGVRDAYAHEEHCLVE